MVSGRWVQFPIGQGIAHTHCLYGNICADGRLKQTVFKRFELVAIRRCALWENGNVCPLLQRITDDVIGRQGCIAIAAADKNGIGACHQPPYDWPSLDIVLAHKAHGLYGIDGKDV